MLKSNSAWSKSSLETIFVHILFFISLFNANYKFAIFLIFTALALMPSKKKNSEFYYLFLLDGLLLVMPIFTI